MVRLTDLISEQERAGVNTQCGYETMMKDVRDLTIGELSKMALILTRTEYGNDFVPECYLPAEAINILFRRAYNIKASIF